ncbi:MAG: class I SAM-dependent methyltransferase, partial [Gaiellaceae bacterium]
LEHDNAAYDLDDRERVRVAVRIDTDDVVQLICEHPNDLQPHKPRSYQVTLGGLGKAAATQHSKVSPQATFRNRVSRRQPESAPQPRRHHQPTMTVSSGMFPLTHRALESKAAWERLWREGGSARDEDFAAVAWVIIRGEMTDPRKAIVQDGYDVIAERYLAWGRAVEGDPRDRFLTELARRLHDNASVLDLGCGAGVPSTKQLSEQFEVVGVDISEAQFCLARANVPAARFMRSDLSELDFEEESFDGITACYSVSHVSREEHGALFKKIAYWLRPGGFFLASLGAADGPDWTGEWLGVPMFFSSYDADTNRRLLKAAGLVPVLDEVVAMQEPERKVAFFWVLVQRQ